MRGKFTRFILPGVKNLSNLPSMHTVFRSVTLLFLLLVSCSNNERTVSRETVSRGDPLLDKYASNFSYGKADGMVRSKSDKKSEFAGKQFHGSNDFSGKNYTTGEYASKRWGGKSRYDSKKYAGNTDASKYQHSPEFVQRQARYGAMVANAQGKGFETGSIDRVNSRENSGRRISKEKSWYGQRNNLGNPVIIPWKEQAGAQNPGKQKLSDLSVDDAKVIMGRSDQGGQ